MPNAADEYQDALIEHQILLLQLSNGLAARFNRLLSNTEQELFETLRRGLDDLGSVPAIDFPAKARAINNLIRMLNEQRGAAWDQATDQLAVELLEIGLDEATSTVGALGKALPVQIGLNRIAAEQVKAAVFKRPFQGRLLKEWAQGLSDNDRRRMSAAVRQGVIEGQTVDDIVRVVRGTRAAGFRDGILQIARREAEAVVRTSVQHVTNAARSDVFEANSDVIAGLLWVSTLDGRTCFTAGHMVAMPDGRELPVESLQKGDWVRGGTSGEPRLIRATRTAMKSTVEVTTSGGRTFRCTPEHPFLTELGWVDAEKLEGLRLYSRIPSSTTQRTLTTSDVVVSVTATGVLETVYDIQVEIDESFICNGVIVHNSSICRDRDGKVSMLHDHPTPKGYHALIPANARPPAHFSCRSVMSAILDPDGIADKIGDRPFVRDTRTRKMREKDFRRETHDELGDAQWRGMTPSERNLAIGDRRRAWTRANVGQVPAETTYQDWLKRQPAAFQDEVLGPARGKLFRSGEETVHSFVDRRGNELTLAQLQARRQAR